MAATENENVLGAAVRRARKGLGWSQEKLAREAGMSREAVRKIENGDTHMPTKLRDIAAALGKQPDQLLGMDVTDETRVAARNLAEIDDEIARLMAEAAPGLQRIAELQAEREQLRQGRAS